MILYRSQSSNIKLVNHLQCKQINKRIPQTEIGHIKLNKHPLETLSIPFQNMIDKPLTLEKAVNKIREARTYPEIANASKEIASSHKISDIELAQHFETLLTDIQSEYTLELKVNIFEVMSALLLSEHKERFMKHFATRLLFFLKKYSVLVSQSSLLSGRVIDVFKRWEEGKTFSIPFFTKLREMANPIFYFNSQQSKQPTFQKYSKNFLLSIRDISKLNFSLTLYQSSTKKNQTKNAIEAIKQSKQQFDHTTEREQIKKNKAKELKKKVETTLEQLIQSLSDNNQGMQELERIVEEEKQIIKQTFKIEIQQ